jgi:hypothetical protein
VKDTLQITKSKIVVSKNELIEGGYYIQHTVHGILPGCRKEQILSMTPMTGYVWVKALFSYNGNAHIHPADWLALVKASPVVAERFFHPSNQLEITPEIKELAYREASRVTNCPAITDTTHVRLGYTPTFNTLKMDKVNQ